MREISQEQQSQLIQLAAQMVMGKSMPSDFIGDWNLPKTTPKKVQRTIIKESEKAQEQAKLWGIALRNILDSLKDNK